jgi:hypothetical protein
MAAMEVVNGYPCKNCTDVEYAKKGIDPAHPKDGPNGVYAADKVKETHKRAEAAKPDDGPADRGPAVTLSGALAKVTPSSEADKPRPYAPGAGFSFTA